MSEDSGAGTGRCPSESAHDFVVVQMNSGINQLCLFDVECSRCGDRASGYYNEIPAARFA